MKKFKISYLVGLLLIFSACELDLLDNPNRVTANNVNPDFLLNRIQFDFASLFNEVSRFGMQVTRMRHSFGNTYETAFLPTDFDFTWSTSYADILVDIKTLIPLAESRSLYTHIGIAKVIQAYVLMTLVDYFGDVPYSEALNPNNFNPGLDAGAAVYNEALTLLDEAIDAFNQTSLAIPVNYFGITSNAAWIKVANTLKLKLLLNRRLVDPSGSTAGINALIASGQLIGLFPENFAFQYSRENANPDSRHPEFRANYETGAGTYQQNYYMWHLTEAKKGQFGFPGVPGDASDGPDPRARYYFFRQVNENPDQVNELFCIGLPPPAHYPPSMPFCLPGNRGYWGRDHLNNEGIPPDNFKRTAPGVYPAGGRFDANNPVPLNNRNYGNQGAGIEPIMMRAFVDFMLAESALFLGTTGNPRALLESGIRKSMEDVRAIALAGLEGSAIQSFQSNTVYTTRVNQYVTGVLNEYDAATDNTARMRIIAREYWLALFGNGVEAYNLYRRTGQPDGMQPGLNNPFGTFPRTFVYPSNFINTNNNPGVNQKPNNSVRVFWDNNPISGWIN
jgi:hypothetical protein